VRVTAAGKAVNVARVAATLGERVVAVGFAGGPSGTELLVDIATVGIDARFVQTIASTRVCVTVIDQESGQTTELIEEANAVTPAEINAFLDQVRRQSCDILVCSGSLAPGVPADIYKQCIDGFAGGTRPITIVDAKGDALRAAAGCRRVILKCNRAEFAETFGGDDFAKVLRPLMDASRTTTTSFAQSLLTAHGRRRSSIGPAS
jgi:fructose-1-phosphate kinase PfkB-like protein